MMSSAIRVALIACCLYYTQTANANSPVHEWKHLMSWQVEHPAATGFLSGLSLGMWPRQFADDVVEKGYNDIPAHQVQMFADANWQHVKTISEGVFGFWRGVGLATWALAIAGLMVARKRVAKRSVREQAKE